MQSLQQKASEWSGVDPNDAFAIDETNLFEKLGLQTFINLSTNFYNRDKVYIHSTLREVGVRFAYTLSSTDPTLRDFTGVYDDEEEWFRSIFSNSSKEDAIRNQYEFFVQRMGGPPLYSERKGKCYLDILFYTQSSTSPVSICRSWNTPTPTYKLFIETPSKFMSHVSVGYPQDTVGTSLECLVAN
ncbi:hypothetical protein MTR67_036214 [Solanum verrucosum]|uniref:Uncharacterized protein n=1 Tax=Solanum verrucosum TaxID=315347 RepID=A0AAF0ZN16_SOLVR|nr:hypothetical protein MTR67_036214 [Solanum verrucosum]